MAQAAEKGAQKTGAEVRLRRVEETLPPDVLQKMGALEAQKAFSSVPTVTPEDLVWSDGSIWASPTRFGNVAAQMKTFMDRCGKLWAEQSLVGKAASAMCSAANQHGGLETTITLGFWPFFAHQGMVIVGLPYSFNGQMGHDEVFGGSPYGASTIAGGLGERLPSARDLAGAEFQGEHLAKIAKQLCHKGASLLTMSSDSSEKEKKTPKKKTDEKRFSEKRHEKHEEKKHDEKKHDEKKHEEKKHEEKKPKSPRKKEGGETKEKSSPTKKKDKN